MQWISFPNKLNFCQSRAKAKIVFWQNSILVQLRTLLTYKLHLKETHFVFKKMCKHILNAQVRRVLGVYSVNFICKEEIIKYSFFRPGSYSCSLLQKVVWLSCLPPGKWITWINENNWNGFRLQEMQKSFSERHDVSTQYSFPNMRTESLRNLTSTVLVVVTHCEWILLIL